MDQQIHLSGILRKALISNLCDIIVKHGETLPLTWVSRQVLEVHWLADLAVRGPAELHFHSNRLREVSVTVRRCAEHNGHLPMDVRLGECALSLPGVLEKTHLDVLCQGNRKQET